MKYLMQQNNELHYSCGTDLKDKSLHQLISDIWTYVTLFS